MTRTDQIRAVAKLGFTERQAGFLVTVLVHAGVCVGRQDTASTPESFAVRRFTTSSQPWSLRSSLLHTRRRTEVPGCTTFR